MAPKWSLPQQVMLPIWLARLRRPPLPVTGIPVEGGGLSSMGALFCISQMSGGTPVATVGVGRGGTKNAALLAIQILSLVRPKSQDKLHDFRASQRQKIIVADKELTSEFRHKDSY